MTAPSWVRKFHKPNSPERLPLLIFPHAGTGASWYREFSKTFSQHFDVSVFQYPGRQDRAAEAALRSLPEIAAGAFEEFRATARDRALPILTFGHSMGALISFEFVRLAEEAGIGVRRMIVVSAVAPHRIAQKPPAPKDDDALLEHLTMLGGTNTDVMASSELLRMSLPVIKGDHRASEAYSCEPTVRIAAGIDVLAGDRDPIVSVADVNGWRRHSDDVEVTMFDGGHFFLTDEVDAIGELVAQRCATDARSPR